MICGNIRDIKDYNSINPYFEKAFEFLRREDLDCLEVGKYNIHGEDVFALVQEYTTELENKKFFESHVKYIDIQYVKKGKELMLYSNIGNLEVDEDLSLDADLIKYKEIENSTRIETTDGDYVIFFPEDGHKPGCASKEPSKVNKVVVKIACK